MSDINIIINGGNNQILPNATDAVQNFYGDKLSEKHPCEMPSEENVLPEVEKLTLYINKENIPQYIALIGECKTASELAKVVVDMVVQEPKLNAEEMVKERFIRLLLPFALKITKGATVDNVRQRINDAWAKRPKS